jgi:hypothetical protein
MSVRTPFVVMVSLQRCRQAVSREIVAGLTL